MYGIEANAISATDAAEKKTHMAAAESTSPEDREASGSLLKGASKINLIIFRYSYFVFCMVSLFSFRVHH